MHFPRVRPYASPETTAATEASETSENVEAPETLELIAPKPTDSEAASDAEPVAE